MSVDLYIGALQGAKNGNEMLEILDLISDTEQEDENNRSGEDPRFFHWRYIHHFVFLILNSSGFKL